MLREVDKEKMSSQKTWPEMLKDFHNGCRDSEDTLTHDRESPGIPGQKVADLRRKLIKEEYEELLGSDQEIGALAAENVLDIAKELCDLIYVCIGTGLAYGIDMDRAFQEVHRSNMSKLTGGKLRRREDGKILKPDTYSPANMSIIW